jgi:hypothetical protein
MRRSEITGKDATFATKFLLNLEQEIRRELGRGFIGRYGARRIWFVISS